MSHNIDCDRRRFLGAALVALGTPLAAITSTARPSDSLGTLKQVVAAVLNVGYTDAGPANGRPVILLHGWPYDIHSFVDVVPLLASAGYRVIVPYLRGFGTTTFLSSDTVRNGQQAALALDVIALMEGNRRRQRVFDRQSRGKSAAVDAAGGVCLVVPVLLRHRTR
jgi:hypothetical protein